MRTIEYPVKVYYLYTSKDECYEVFAMDTQDAFNTLLENEPNLKIDDIICALEHPCASPKDTIH